MTRQKAPIPWQTNIRRVRDRAPANEDGSVDNATIIGGSRIVSVANLARGVAYHSKRVVVSRHFG
jgi:hypothetical protein